MASASKYQKEPEIFLQAFELTSAIIQSTSLFPKPRRYVIGKKLEEKALDFLLLLNRLVGPSGLRFQSHREKLKILEELSLLLDEFRVLLRICRETGSYSAGQFRDINAKVQSIGKQIGGLIRAEKVRL